MAERKKTTAMALTASSGLGKGPPGSEKRLWLQESSRYGGRQQVKTEQGAAMTRESGASRAVGINGDKGLRRLLGVVRTFLFVFSYTSKVIAPFAHRPLSTIPVLRLSLFLMRLNFIWALRSGKTGLWANHPTCDGHGRPVFPTSPPTRTMLEFHEFIKIRKKESSREKQYLTGEASRHFKNQQIAGKGRSLVIAVESVPQGTWTADEGVVLRSVTANTWRSTTDSRVTVLSALMRPRHEHLQQVRRSQELCKEWVKYTDGT